MQLWGVSLNFAKPFESMALQNNTEACEKKVDDWWVLTQIKTNPRHDQADTLHTVLTIQSG